MKKFFILTAIVMLFSGSAFSQYQYFEGNVYVDVVKVDPIKTFKIDIQWVLRNGQIVNSVPVSSPVSWFDLPPFEIKGRISTWIEYEVVKTIVRVEFFDREDNMICGKCKEYPGYNMGVFSYSQMGTEYH